MEGRKLVKSLCPALSREQSALSPGDHFYCLPPLLDCFHFFAVPLFLLNSAWQLSLDTPTGNSFSFPSIHERSCFTLTPEGYLHWIWKFGLTVLLIFTDCAISFCLHFWWEIQLFKLLFPHNNEFPPVFSITLVFTSFTIMCLGVDLSFLNLEVFHKIWQVLANSSITFCSTFFSSFWYSDGTNVNRTTRLWSSVHRFGIFPNLFFCHLDHLSSISLSDSSPILSFILLFFIPTLWLLFKSYGEDWILVWFCSCDRFRHQVPVTLRRLWLQWGFNLKPLQVTWMHAIISKEPAWGLCGVVSSVLSLPWVPYSHSAGWTQVFMNNFRRSFFWQRSVLSPILPGSFQLFSGNDFLPPCSCLKHTGGGQRKKQWGLLQPLGAQFTGLLSLGTQHCHLHGTAWRVD